MAASILGSCGGDKTDKKPSDGFTTTTLAMDPIRLTKQNKNCVGTFSAGEGAYFYIPQFLSGNLVETRHEFTSQLQGNNIKSPLRKPISNVTYGLDYSYNVLAYFVGGKWILKKVSDEVEIIKSPAKELDVCPSEVTYNPFTYESSGLNISNSITKTYEKVAAHGIELDAVSVRVAPFLYQDIRLKGAPGGNTRKFGYEVDNAYYNPRNKEITFLPQSKTYQKKRDSTPYWQMPMVGSHEYGHHIFTSLVGDSVAKSIEFTKNCFQGHDKTVKFFAQGEVGSKRDNSYKFALGSINEGFADLIAKYTLSSEESSMTNIICFEDNRDAGNDSFKEGAKKIFDKNALNLIDGEQTVRAPKSCNQPNFQEIHHVGAVFAYSADKILSAYSEDSDLKLKVLLQFAKELRTRQDALVSKKAGDYLHISLTLLNMTAAKVLNTPATESHCDVLGEIFPDNEINLCETLRENL